MPTDLPSVSSSEAPLDAIPTARKPIALLVGASPTAPESSGTPGVPGTFFGELLAQNTSRPEASHPRVVQRFMRMAAASMLVGSAAMFACEAPQPLPSNTRQASPESDFVRDIKALRDRNHVREFAATNEVTSLINMPTGTFGFAPAATLGSIRSANIHRTQPVDSFELHRLRNGAHVLLGFVSSPESETLERGTATAFEVSPVPTTTLTNLVMIPVERIRSAQLVPNVGQLSVKLDLAPAPPRRR